VPAVGHGARFARCGTTLAEQLRVMYLLVRYCRRLTACAASRILQRALQAYSEFPTAFSVCRIRLCFHVSNDVRNHCPTITKRGTYALCAVHSLY